MGQNDSNSGFGDEGRTIYRPSPGGRRRQSPAPGPMRRSRMDRAERSDIDMGVALGQKSNPLSSNALSLLMIVPKLRKLAFHSAVSTLQERLINEIGAFQNRSLQQGATEEQVREASYMVCSLVDEAVLNTPWGTDSNWGHDSLLVKFHGEAWGGEEFFHMVDRFMKRPNQNLDLLELAYLCLSLGFEGKYRHSPTGLRDLEALREEVFLQIQRIRGDMDRSLSVNWRGLKDLRSPLSRYVPIWVLACLAGLVLLGVFAAYCYTLNGASSRVFGQWEAIAREAPKVNPVVRPAALIVPKPPAMALTPVFQKVLADEIARKLVIVLPGPILRLTAAFPSGSDQIRKQYIPLLNKVAAELKTNKIRHVEVSGDTDNVPIRTLQFPSNWALSEARAKRIAQMLDPSGALAGRITCKGLGDTEPVVPNDTAAHRAMNRRVDIHIW